jgi:propionyl-CoA synthetase
MAGRYAEIHARSLKDPQGFWGEVAEGIAWTRKWDRVLDDSRPPFYRWFAGGELNTCFNALDRHLAKRGDQAALIYDSPVTNTVRTYTYRQLTDEVARFAGVLAGLGITRGDRVIVYMPMVPEAVIAMLACARIGAIHSVVFGGFAANELATRIDDSGAKAIVSASCGIEIQKVIPYKPLIDAAINLARHKPSACVILRRPMQDCTMVARRDVDWNEAMAKAKPAACVPVKATDPLYILYTSGTTGQPKGVVRDNGGHAVALHYSMKAIYDVEPGDVYWAASDVGWVVGHSYMVYAPLLQGSTSVMYEGKPVGTPDAGQARLAERGGAGLRRTGRRLDRRGAARRHRRRDRGEAAAAAGLPADAVARRHAVRRVVPRRAPGLLHDRRRRIPRRGRLPVRDGPDRRRHQRRRPPAVDRRDRAGAGEPPGGGRVRRHRRTR